MSAAAYTPYWSKRPPEARKILFLDIDHTLVYTTEGPQPPIGWTTGSDYVEIQDPQGVLFVRIRPGAREFVKCIRDYYDVYFFSAGDDAYVSLVIDVLWPNAPHERRLGRSYCRSDGVLKDLTYAMRMIGMTFDPRTCFILDDRAAEVIYPTENGLSIDAFCPRDSNVNDITGLVNNTLLHVYQKLLTQVEFLAADDVREPIRKYNTALRRATM